MVACAKCICACDCCVDRVRGDLVPALDLAAVTARAEKAERELDVARAAFTEATVDASVALVQLTHERDEARCDAAVYKRASDGHHLMACRNNDRAERWHRLARRLYRGRAAMSHALAWALRREEARHPDELEAENARLRAAVEAAREALRTYDERYPGRTRDSHDAARLRAALNALEDKEGVR